LGPRPVDLVGANAPAAETASVNDVLARLRFTSARTASNASPAVELSRNPVQAPPKTREARGRPASWILEADIESFFDSIDRKMLMEMLQERVADTSLLRLVGKCLHVGILDGERCSEPRASPGGGAGSSKSPSPDLARGPGR
jgi:hypothetical protein